VKFIEKLLERYEEVAVPARKPEGSEDYAGDAEVPDCCKVD